jgi:hypothetical protein
MPAQGRKAIVEIECMRTCAVDEGGFDGRRREMRPPNRRLIGIACVPSPPVSDLTHLFQRAGDTDAERIDQCCTSGRKRLRGNVLGVDDEGCELVGGHCFPFG